MKVVIVHIGDVALCPPVINLINMLEKIKINTILITTKSKTFDRDAFPLLKVEKVDYEYELNRTVVRKFIDMLRIKKKIWMKITELYDDKTVIWITSDTAIKHLGNKVLKYKYVLQQMELSENIEYYSKIPFLHMNAHKIGNKAIAVVVPEYNRAHIVKAWWKLDKVPFVLSNKPSIKTEFLKQNEIDDPEAKKIIDKIKDKKIILYQGIIHKERPLDKYIYAVDKLGSNYAFVVMSNGEDIYKNIGSKNYYFIPFVTPPKHLQITSHAYIGVLSYFPTKSQYSVLSAVFCAPNKTFEYAMFGIPMIGNDNPGLYHIFNSFGVGICIKNFEVDEICNAILSIEKNYDIMSNNSKIYYDETDTLAQLKKILDVIR